MSDEGAGRFRGVPDRVLESSARPGRAGVRRGRPRTAAAVAWARPRSFSVARRAMPASSPRAATRSAGSARRSAPRPPSTTRPRTGVRACARRPRARVGRDPRPHRRGLPDAEPGRAGSAGGLVGIGSRVARRADQPGAVLHRRLAIIGSTPPRLVAERRGSSDVRALRPALAAGKFARRSTASRAPGGGGASPDAIERALPRSCCVG